MNTAPQDWLGAELSGGRYRIAELLGEGGMGTVYRAHDENLDCDVVVKVPHGLMLKQRDFAQRFDREIRSLVQLTHPHIVKIIDVGQHEEIPFAVMQYLSGGDLEDRRRRDHHGNALPMPPDSLADWLPRIAEALDYIHDEKYVHRDVKPANILFDKRGHPFLSDFGIAKAFVDSGAAAQTRGLTGTGMVLGTADYMAPEVVINEPYDGRADQYSLAVSVYELLSGEQPFVATAAVAVLVAKVTNSAPPLESVVSHLPNSLCGAVDRALAKDPRQRYQSCAAFSAAALTSVAQSASAARLDGEKGTGLICAQHPAGRRGKLAPSPFPTQQQTSSKFGEPAAKPLPTGRTTATVAAGATELVRPQERTTTPAAGDSRSKLRWMAAVGGLALLSLLLVLTLIVVLWRNDRPIADSTNPEVANQPDTSEPDDSGDDSAIENTPAPAPMPVDPQPANPSVPPVNNPPAPQPPPAAPRPRLLDPDWIERRLAEVGVDALLADYNGVTDPDEQTVRSALQRSQRALRENPSELRMQLQARLVSHTSARLRPFQSLPTGRGVQLHSQWPSFIQAGSPQPGTFIGHPDHVRCLAITPDGRTVVSGSSDHSLKVWDLASGREKRTLSGHTGHVNCVAITPDGRTAVSGSENHSLKVWDLASGRELRTLSGHTDDVTCVAIPPDGRTVVSGSFDTTLKVWDLATGQQLRSISVSLFSLTSVAITPDGRTALAGSIFGRLKVWELATGREKRTFTGHSGRVFCVAITPDGRTAVSGSADDTLKVWDLASGRELRTLSGHSLFVECVAITPDGRTVVSGSSDNRLKVWDLASGKQLCSLTMDVALYACAIAPDGRTLLVGDAFGRLSKFRIDP